jgi:hypothetical protein
MMGGGSGRSSRDAQTPGESPAFDNLQVWQAYR